LLVIRFPYSVWNAQRICSNRNYGYQPEYQLCATINCYGYSRYFPSSV